MALGRMTCDCGDGTVIRYVPAASGGRTMKLINSGLFLITGALAVVGAVVYALIWVIRRRFS
jgi:hypothetical protein